MLNVILYGGYDTYFMRGGYGLDWTYLLVLIGGLLSLAAQAGVKSAYSKYSRIAASCGLTGAEIASQILRGAGITNVKIQHISGSLTDNFNPSSMTLNLSDVVYGSSSIAAIAVASHECGHAIQHNEGYEPLKIRSAFFPVANFGSRYGIYILLLGVFLAYFQPLITIGIVLFSFGFLFQVVTLPVEFDASRRALAILEQSGVLVGRENEAAEKVLKAAAYTYVAAAAASFLSLMRLILRYGGRGRRRG